jgi:diguanylate cyclase (GGDEF)-like protein
MTQHTLPIDPAEKCYTRHPDLLCQQHAEITTYWMLAEQYNWQEDALEKLKQITQSLAENATQYHYTDIYLAAMRVIELLQFSPYTSQAIDLQHALQSLCGLLMVRAQNSQSRVESFGSSRNPPYQLLCLFENPDKYDSLLASLQAQHHRIQLGCDQKQLEKYLTLTPLPDVIILDILFQSKLSKKALSTMEIKAHLNNIPCIFISEYNDFISQLKFIETGANAHLIYPFPINQLMKTINELLMQENRQYKILLIEEEPQIVLEHQAILRQQGMDIQLLNRAENLIEMLVEFVPDLILLDTQLSDIDPYQLASLIRQENAYLHIPVIFLVTHNDEEQHLAALKAGGNDTIERHTQREHLLALIDVQLNQNQRLKKITAWDGLTGLLNHDYFILHLNASLANAERAGSPVAVAILDIDHFRDFNRQHSYWTGNIVLKQMTRALKHRLRRGDLLGRLWGGSFIIALYDADYHSAQQVVESIVKELSQAEYHLAEDHFTISISAGIAYYPGHLQTEQQAHFDVLKIAQEALQMAKEKGQGSVVIRSLTSDF